jgi:hypothetical protein
MKSFTRAHGLVRTLSVAAISSITLVWAVASVAQPTDQQRPPQPPPTDRSQGTPPLETAQTREAWSQAMRRLPVPKTGCFESAFPRVEWKEVPCPPPPKLVPHPPAPGPHPATHNIGGGGPTDYSAKPTGTISAAEGTFDSVTGVTSITDSLAGANAYSIQLNTNQFMTSVCSGSPNPDCKGWQQFVYSNIDGSGVVQYWLIKYNAACPAGGGWTTFMFPAPSTDTYCYKNGASTVSFPVQTIANLASLGVAGTAAAGGNDSLIVTTAAGIRSAANPDSQLNLAAGWTDAEYNIFGDHSGSLATFNAGSTIVVRTTVHNGTTNAPTCAKESFTGETNSLTLVGAPAVVPGPAPAVVFTQSNVPGTAASCAAASGTGEPHLTTFNGLYYDFQATGDFVLADTGPAFSVQARQVSIAPTWPNVAVYKAVATRMGKTTVAVCLPGRVEINGKSVRIRDGKSILMPNGVQVSRNGNAYVVTNESGDSLRAELNTGFSGYINVFIGLGHWPNKVRGLYTNANNNPNQIEMSDGTVLTEPVPFEVLYYRYGESWRARKGESILCKDPAVKDGNPAKPFYATDLDRRLAERARAVCLKAGVKEGPLLDACTLDVAVLGSKAAKVFVSAPTPVAVAPH